MLYKLPDNYKLVGRTPESTSLPYDLEREKHMDYTFILHDIKKELLDRGYSNDACIFGVYKDAVGKEYYTGPLTIGEIFENANITLESMQEAARELNEKLGLEPPIEENLEKPELADKLKKAGELINFEADSLTQKTLGVLQGLGIK